MKKQLAVILAVLTLLVSAGCSPADTQDAGKAKAAQEQQLDKTKKGTEINTIGEIAGIGDTAQAWEDEFGHPYSQGDTLKIYKGGLYEVVFENDRAVTITLPAQDGKEPAVRKILPRDGKKQSENSQQTGGLTMTAEKWHSDMLEKAIPDTKGTYTVMKNMNGNDYDSIVIDCTPNLKK